MAKAEGEKTLAEQNKDLRDALIDLAASDLVGGCSWDVKGKRAAADLVDVLGATDAELELAFNKASPKIKQLQEIKSRLGIV